MNREIKDGICPSCNEAPEKKAKYMKATLTLEKSDKSAVVNLTLFYPDYCTLCALNNLNTELDKDLVQANLLSLLGKHILYNTRKTCIANISMKRKSEKDKSKPGDSSVQSSLSVSNVRSDDTCVCRDYQHVSVEIIK